MIKEWTNDKGVKYLFVGVPSEKNIISDKNHNHYWFGEGILYESYNTLRGLRYREILDTGDENIDFHEEHELIGLSKDLAEDQWKEISNWIYENNYQSIQSVIMSLGFKENENVLVLKVKE